MRSECTSGEWLKPPYATFPRSKRLTLFLRADRSSQPRLKRWVCGADRSCRAVSMTLNLLYVRLQIKPHRMQWTTRRSHHRRELNMGMRIPAGDTAVFSRAAAGVRPRSLEVSFRRFAEFRPKRGSQNTKAGPCIQAPAPLLMGCRAPQRHPTFGAAATAAGWSRQPPCASRIGGGAFRAEPRTALKCDIFRLRHHPLVVVPNA